jgi:hypothetical protein
MRIYEILHCNNSPTEGGPGSYLGFPSGPLANLASAFTRDGRVKQFWNVNGSDMQPSGPVPPAGTELTPRGTSEPSGASWEAEAVENDPPLGQHRLDPFRRYRGV